MQGRPLTFSAVEGGNRALPKQRRSADGGAGAPSAACPGKAFNHAFASHAGDARQEEAAHRIAWAAVKRSYVKVGGSWVGFAARV
jgi:hypothetical protein